MQIKFWDINNALGSMPKIQTMGYFTERPSRGTNYQLIKSSTN